MNDAGTDTQEDVIIHPEEFRQPPSQAPTDPIPWACRGGKTKAEAGEHSMNVIADILWDCHERSKAKNSQQSSPSALQPETAASSRKRRGARTRCRLALRRTKRTWNHAWKLASMQKIKLIVFLKAIADWKPYALPFQEELPPEHTPDTWWNPDGQSFLYTDTAYGLWPCGQSIGNQQTIETTNPDLEMVKNGNEQIMKTIEQEENIPSVSNDGSAIKITNITPHTKKFILNLAVKTGDDWKPACAPVAMKFAGGSTKTTIENWPACFALLIKEHPKKGSLYQL